MRDTLKCNCHICKTERHLFVSVSDHHGTERFLRLAAHSPVLTSFTSATALVDHLHAQRDGDYCPPSASEVLGALIQASPEIADPEISQSVLVLAFMPAIHRTYRETRAWFQDIPTDDIAQQILLFFLELAASAPVGLLNGQLPFALARSLRRNTLRWARREQLMLMDRERFAEERAGQAEPSEDAHFESISLLRDFLDYCVRIGILSEFERDLLIKVKVDGFVAKEVMDRHTVLSPKAVHVRIQRIMKRLQQAAGTLNGASAKPVKSEERDKSTKLSESVSTFSLSTSTVFLAIGKSRRQLSLDSSPTQTDTKRQQLAPFRRNVLATFATLPKAIRRTRVIPGATSRRLAAITSSGSPFPLCDPTRSGESSPSNPDAGPARIIRKEIAGNEEILPKQICLPLAPARIRHILLLADSCISGIRSGGRWLAVGERRQRFDASVHNHNRSRPFSRLYCGRRFDVRFW